MELKNSVAKLLSENERLCNEINHVKQVFKEQFDLIKKTRVRSKEQSDSLNDKLNLKSRENKDLKAELQDKECSSLILNLWPLGLKCSTSKCGSKSIGNKRNDRISQTPSRNMKNKVEAQPRKVNKKNCVVKPVHDVDVKHSVLNTNFEPICATCKKSLFVDVHDMCSSKKSKIVESKTANHSEPNHTWGSNDADFLSSSSLVMIGTVRFRNDNIARIMGYGDYQVGNITILRVYYVEGLGHNFFLVGQFCDADLEVAFRKNTCFIRNLEGVDLLSGSRDTNLYTFSLDDMLKTSSICLLSKASKTKSWLWHHRLSYLNFGTLNKLAKDGLARVIVDDYSRFTWVRFLRTKDEAPEAIIKYIKNIQVRLNAIVRNVQTDNRTKFVNQTLREFYQNVGISHQTSVARTP
ncbi:retrovirus-related pol polyprotein from transposon TNT 1-94 [Tanacetum coccineum]